MPPCRYIRGGKCRFEPALYPGKPCIGATCCYRHELPGLADLKAILVYLLEV